FRLEMSHESSDEKEGVPPEDSLIFLEINNLSKLGVKGKWSEMKRIGGFPWDFLVTVQNHGKKKILCVQLDCNKSDEASVWFCVTSFWICLVNQDDPQNSIRKEYHKQFESLENNVCTEKELIDMEKILDPTLGFIKDDKIIVQVRVVIEEEENGDRFRPLPVIEMFLPLNGVTSS
ncbi:hypothetical protein PFISCL1PPCAC_20261, partial [Pristionchus fissidentatus]